MMEPAPKEIDGADVVCYTRIDERHRFTGNTRQIVAGQVMGPMAALAICQYPDHDGFYLFGCDAEWSRITDTYHDTLKDAQEQAEFEYEGVTQSWTHVA